MFRVPKLLLIVCDTREKLILQQNLAAHAELTWICHPQEMAQEVKQDSFDAVFCGRSLCAGSWREALEELRQLNPRLPVIILSPTVNEGDWTDVLDAGGFDLLCHPCQERTVLSVMEHAVVSHEARAWHDNDRLPTAKAG